MGFIRTPLALISLVTDYKKSDIISEFILTQFAIANIGEIRTNWDKEDGLVDFIRHRNHTN